MKNFISSIVPSSISTRASSSQARIIDESTMQLIKKNLSYSKSVSEWIDEMLEKTILFISKYVLFYIQVVVKRKELMAELWEIRKDQSSLYVLSQEIKKLISMDRMKLINEQIVSDSKELDPSWPNSFEWKLSVYDTLLKEISIELEKYLDKLVEIKGNCHDLKVEITDEFDEKIIDSKEIFLKFK